MRTRSLSVAVCIGLMSSVAPLAAIAQRACSAIQPDAVAGPAVEPQTVADVGSLSGRPIAWVHVITHAPDPLPGPAAILDGIHVRTRPNTVRRELLFAAGDTVDSIRVAESMRRLRALRYLANVLLSTSPAGNDACSSSRASVVTLRPLAAIGLTVTTRDSWSTQPSLRAGGGAAGNVVGLEERNLLGTGRVAKAYLRTDNGRVGAGVAYIDPWLFERDVALSLSRDVFRDGSALRTSIRTHERSVFDPWAVELELGHTDRAAYGATLGGAGDTVRHSFSHLLFDRLIAASPGGATRLLFGIEGEQVRETASLTAPVLGPLDIHRSFFAFDIGAARRTASYGENDWLLPQRSSGSSAIADIPRGAEGEIIAGVGHDFLTGSPAIHLDAWGGRIWMPGQQSLITADAWASGFRTGADWTAASVRAALGAYRDAAHGLWIAHAAVEQLSDPDPTVRALASFDPTLASLPPRNRLAETAVAGSLERTLHVRRVTGAYMLDIAAFGAGSLRWDPAASVAERFGVAAVGAGLRLSPLREGVATLRLDVGYPVMHSIGLSSRPFIAVSISPWLGAGRHLEGSAIY